MSEQENPNQSLESQIEVIVSTETVEFSLEQAVPIIEAIIFANGIPISLEKICDISNIQKDLVSSCLEFLISRYSSSESFGIELVKVGEDYQFRTKAAYAEPIRLLKEEKPKRLSVAALETLAIIAYRQPVVKSEIEAIRGVDATPTIKTLLEKNIVKIVGHQSTVGNPALYGTTDEFLKLFSLGSLAELPSLREITEIEQDPGENDSTDSDSVDSDERSSDDSQHEESASVVNE